MQSRPGHTAWIFSAVAAQLFVAQAAKAEAPCGVPENIVRFQHPLLPATPKRNKPYTYKFVLIGSSSIEGIGAPKGQDPARLFQQEMAPLFPNDTVTVTNEGIGGQNIEQIAARFENAINGADAVGLQTFTNDAFHGKRFADVEPTLKKMIDIARKKGVRVFLITPQYTLRVVTTAGMHNMVEDILAFAKREKIPVSDRYHGMEFEVVQSDMFNRGRPSDNVHQGDYRCFAAQMRWAILDDMQRAKEPVPVEHKITSGPRFMRAQP